MQYITLFIQYIAYQMITAYVRYADSANMIFLTVHLN